MIVVFVASASAVMTVIGGLAALRAGRHRNLVLGLAAGLMLGVVGFELLPESLRQNQTPVMSTPTPLVLSVGGYLLLHVIERSFALHRGHESAYRSHQHDHAAGTLAASALVAQSVLDGFALGVAFQVSAQIGIAVAVAVIAHDFANGFNTYTITTLHGNDRRRGLLLLGADAAAPLLGAGLSLSITISTPALGPHTSDFSRAF